MKINDNQKVPPDPEILHLDLWNEETRGKIKAGRKRKGRVGGLEEKGREGDERGDEGKGRRGKEREARKKLMERHLNIIFTTEPGKPFSLFTCKDLV